MSNNSIILGHFLPSSLLQQSTPIRRLTSTSSDSEDSGVDPSYRQERKIFVGGVPSSVGPEELAHFFQSYGQVEEAFIIYDRYSGRHRGFGFVTFADMATTKIVCSTRIFNLHGRKIECKRALKREEILAGNEGDSNDYKSFRPNNICSSPSPPVAPSSTNIPLCPPPSYGQYHQSPPTLVNSLGGWIINPSMQHIPQIFHPMFNPHQQYAVFPLSSFMWNNPYQQATMQSPFIQELMIPSSSSSMMNV
jgi:RNA recognition motif-containing protein